VYPSINDLINDIKVGSIKYVVEYGASIFARPLPSISVIKGNGDNGDTYNYQIWVYFPIGEQTALDKYMRSELPLLLSDRRDFYRKRVWRYSNNYDSATVIHEGSQNFLRAGLLIVVPKVMRFFSADV
jgi:hypothetical protein